MSSASASLRTSQNARLYAASRCGSVSRSKLDSWPIRRSRSEAFSHHYILSACVLFPDILLTVRAARPPAETGLGGCARESCLESGLHSQAHQVRRSAMKNIVSTLIALSVFGLVAPLAS